MKSPNRYREPYEFEFLPLFICLLVMNAASVRIASGATTASLPQTITQACLEQDKPACLFRDEYVRKRDGSEVVKITLAYPPVQGRSSTRDPGRLVSMKKLKLQPLVLRAPQPGPPTIVITNPTSAVTSQPMIQIQGVSDKPLQRISYDIVNAEGRRSDKSGFVVDSFFDTTYMLATTNFFQCFDIELAPGTNTIAIRCEDSKSRVVTTILNYVFRLDQDRTPPRISIKWPMSARHVSGDSLVVVGQVDDFTAKVRGTISAEGRTNLIESIVERNGRFRLEKIPLHAKISLLTISATDAAGNSTLTNIPIVRSDTTLTIDPVPEEHLWDLQVKVTGKVSPPNQDVWVNDRPATVKSDGTWVATGVVPRGDNVAVFEATAAPKSIGLKPKHDMIAHSSSSVVSEEAVSIQASLNSESMILNVSQPTHGTFKLHMIGTAGQSFVLQASTNLISWVPLLTNRNSGATFDYIDSHATDYGSRFYRIVPTN